MDSGRVWTEAAGLGSRTRSFMRFYIEVRTKYETHLMQLRYSVVDSVLVRKIMGLKLIIIKFAKCQDFQYYNLSLSNLACFRPNLVSMFPIFFLLSFVYFCRIQ